MENSALRNKIKVKKLKTLIKKYMKTEIKTQNSQIMALPRPRKKNANCAAVRIPAKETKAQ